MQFYAFICNPLIFLKKIVIILIIIDVFFCFFSLIFIYKTCYSTHNNINTGFKEKNSKPLTININIKMKAIVEKINEAIAAFQKDAALQVENGNKAAGARARKASLEIEKLMKQFRKDSIEASKK